MAYRVDLNAIGKEQVSFDFEIDDTFFAALKQAVVEDGVLSAHVDIQPKAGDSYRMQVGINGYVVVPCDRCLEPMQWHVSVQQEVNVEKTTTVPDVNSDVVLSEKDGTLDLAPLLYDFIAVAIPIQHTHAEGECNEEMINKLSSYMVN
jgi:uncharacterized metal-binding protein YceD (DUF177 family)